MSRQLQPIDLVAPGFRGLNLSQAGSLLDPSFATRAQNALVDSSGRLAAREGYSDVTTTDITSTPTVKTLWEYRDGAGASEYIVAWNGGIGNDIDDPEGNDISGSVTDTDGRWWFQNFNGRCIGFQNGQKPIVYTGTGNFATVVESAGTAPTSSGGVGFCGYGRVWGLGSDRQTIQYTTLLDETDWGSAGSGSIDMSNVWTDGMDEVKAITAFNGNLVVFGKRHIVFWNDGTGSQLGLDPDNIVVTDVITGTGCVTQWSLQSIGEADLLYLSSNGIQSLKRTLLTTSNPVNTVTKNVRNLLLDDLKDLSDVDTIRSTYSPRYGFYLLTIPAQTSPVIDGITYCVDQRFPYKDQSGEVLNIITVWTLAPTAWLTADNYSTYLGNTVGVGLYGGETDDNGSTFRFIYQSPWLNLGEDFADYLKMLKRIGAILFVKNNTSIVFKWATDFDDSFATITRSVTGDASSDYNEAEWGASEYAGGLALRIIKVPARDKGQYFKLGVEADVNGQFALQQLELFTKIGRLA